MTATGQDVPASTWVGTRGQQEQALRGWTMQEQARADTRAGQQEQVWGILTMPARTSTGGV